MTVELACTACGTTTEDGTGWRAEIAPDDAGADVPEIAVYCPECWEREFGDPQEADAFEG